MAGSGAKRRPARRWPAACPWSWRWCGPDRRGRRGGHDPPRPGLRHLGATLWGGTAAAAQLFGALNAAYGERESRGLLRLYAVALLFALGAGAFVLVALAAIAVPAALGAQAGTGSDADTVLRLGRWPVLLVAVSVVLEI